MNKPRRFYRIGPGFWSRGDNFTAMHLKDAKACAHETFAIFTSPTPVEVWYVRDQWNDDFTSHSLYERRVYVARSKNPFLHAKKVRTVK